MRATSKVFYAIAVYLIAAIVIYVFGVNFVKDDGYLVGPEWAGTIGMVLAALLSLMLGAYLHFTDNRSDIVPEDWEEAEVEDGAGVYGFFSPTSVWPFWMTMSIAVLGLGVIFMYFWLIALGAAMLVYTVARLSLQYAMPKEKH